MTKQFKYNSIPDNNFQYYNKQFKQQLIKEYAVFEYLSKR